MKRIYWSLVGMSVLLFLSLKANWPHGTDLARLVPLALSAGLGAVMGFFLALVTEPVRTGVDRLKKIPLWAVATSAFGIALAQGSAPLRDILRITLWAVLIGVIIGLVHYIALEATARRQLHR